MGDCPTVVVCVSQPFLSSGNSHATLSRIRSVKLFCGVGSDTSPLCRSLEHQRPALGSPWMLLPMGIKLLKPFLPSSFKVIVPSGEWSPYCVHQHVILGLVQRSAMGPRAQCLAWVPGSHNCILEGGPQRKALALQQRKEWVLQAPCVEGDSQMGCAGGRYRCPFHRGLNSVARGMGLSTKETKCFAF